MCTFGFGINYAWWLLCICGFFLFLLPPLMYLLSPKPAYSFIEAEGKEDEDSLEIVEDEVDVGEGEDTCKGFT